MTGFQARYFRGEVILPDFVWLQFDKKAKCTQDRRKLRTALPGEWHGGQVYFDFCHIPDSYEMAISFFDLLCINYHLRILHT